MPTQQAVRDAIELRFRGLDESENDPASTATPQEKLMNGPNEGLALKFGDNGISDYKFIIVDNQLDPQDRADEPWVRLGINLGVREQETIGAKPQFQTPGTVDIEVRLKTGRDRPSKPVNEPKFDVLASNLGKIFDSVSFSGIHFQAASQQVIGAEGKWFLVIVSVPFQYYDQK